MADRTFWKAFFGAAIGKVVIVVFIAICALLGFGPETWAAYMVTEFPLWVTPTVAQTAFIALGFSAFLVAFKPWGWLAKSPEKIALGVPQGIIETVSGNKSKRMPLIELRDFIVQQPGWEQIEENLEYLDLIKAFREVAHEERFEVWGRKNTKSGLFENEKILQKIPSDYWKDGSLDELRFHSTDDNRLICTYILEVNKRGLSPTFSDLEVEKKPALEWAQEDAARYRGEEDRASGRVTVYRGCSAARKRGLSWTTNCKVAEKFAIGHRGFWVPNAGIASCIVSREIVLGRKDERNENELILDYRKLPAITFERTTRSR